MIDPGREVVPAGQGVHVLYTHVVLMLYVLAAHWVHTPSLYEHPGAGHVVHFWPAEAAEMQNMSKMRAAIIFRIVLPPCGGRPGLGDFKYAGRLDPTHSTWVWLGWSI